MRASEAIRQAIQDELSRQHREGTGHLAFNLPDGATVDMDLDVTRLTAAVLDVVARPHPLARPVRILMSLENPNGWKLEELAEQLRLELLGKCRKVEDDTRPQAQAVFLNNLTIIGLLSRIQLLQAETMVILLQLGPDQGPTGTPRVGEGSAPA